LNYYQVLEPVGVPSDERKEQPRVIRIPGLDGEYKIPIMIQDKDHYDLFRNDSNRYPLFSGSGKLRTKLVWSLPIKRPF